jgi:hypothetical protein
MTFPVTIRDPGTLSGARVTKNGEMPTGALNYSEPHYVKITVANDIYNIVPAETGKRFVSTGMLIATSKNLSTEKTIEVYESLAADSGGHAKDIISVDMLKNERVPIPLRNAATESTRWINANCDGNDVSITIWGYYVNA